MHGDQIRTGKPGKIGQKLAIIPSKLPKTHERPHRDSRITNARRASAHSWRLLDFAGSALSDQGGLVWRGLHAVILAGGLINSPATEAAN